MNYIIIILLSIVLLILNIIYLTKRDKKDQDKKDQDKKMKNIKYKNNIVSSTGGFNLEPPCNLGCALALVNPKGPFTKNGQTLCTNGMIRGTENMSIDCFEGMVECNADYCCGYNCVSCPTRPPPSDERNPQTAVDGLLEVTNFLEEYPFMIFP